MQETFIVTVRTEDGEWSETRRTQLDFSTFPYSQSVSYNRCCLLQEVFREYVIQHGSGTQSSVSHLPSCTVS